ncbi:MAG: hypothetical protein ACOCUD_04705 [Bacillota bacterium]
MINIPNLQLYNMRNKGKIESDKMNFVFDSVKRDLYDFKVQSDKNKENLISSIEDITEENNYLHRKIRYLENKYHILKTYIEKGGIL